MDYSRLLATAQRLLASDGQPVTITNETTGAYDPSTATVAVTDAPVVTTGVIMPLSQGIRGFRYGVADEPGTLILSSDQQLFLPGDIAQPSIGARVQIGSNYFTMIAVSPLNPGGTCVVYDCVVRGAS